MPRGSRSDGVRREDAVRLGPQHIRGGRRQAKNEDRTPVIPLHPPFKATGGSIFERSLNRSGSDQIGVG